MSSVAEPDTRATIIFDLGGVLVDWNPRYLYRRHFADEADMEQFLREVVTSPWNHQCDAGKSMAQAIAERVALFPGHANLIRLWQSDWEHTLRGPIAGTVHILRALARGGRRLVALTNWSAETFPVARRRFDFLSHFEDILVSGEHGVAKPDRAIFELACARWRLRPAQALFIDDNADNIATARAMGFDTIHFTAPEALSAALVERGYDC